MLITTVPKLSEDGATVNCPLTPVPVSATVCGLPPAVSVIDKFPENGPTVVGAKVTLIVQDEAFVFGTSVAPLQLSVSVKPVGTLTAEIVTLAALLAVTVTG